MLSDFDVNFIGPSKRPPQALTSFYQRSGLKYEEFKLHEALYSCQEAVNRGFPMTGTYSIRSYMAAGVGHVPPLI